jgi:glutamate racemase
MISDQQPPASAPLLFFDSGIGGLSVLREVQKGIPLAPIVYAADYAGMPYGARSESEIASRVPALLGRLVERYQPRLVVIACNTACTIALSHVRAALDLPIVGTVPAIKPASEITKSGVIGLLGTAATIRQPYIDQLQADFATDMLLLRHAAPELVLAAESKMRGEVVDPAIYKAAIDGLRQQNGGENLDVIILGCTHFPLLQDELTQVAPDISYVDGAAGIARRILHLTSGQQWPEEAADGIFVTTGDLQQMDDYKAALSKFNLTHFDKL